jgi:hypothetical protein
MSSDRSDADKRWAVGQLTVAAIWLGMLVGVSFLATPAKFLAPSLSLPVALDVGRHTFLVFSRVEWGLSIILLALVLAGVRSWMGVTGAVIAGALVLIETVWLFPLLDSRVTLIIAGQQPAPSQLHTLYIICELAKLVSLMLIILDAARRIMAKGRASASTLS